MSNTFSHKMLLEAYANMTVAQRIKARREQLNIKQAELALISGISQAQISRYEAGTNEPTAHALYQLAKVLNTSTDFLVGLTEEINEIRSDVDLSDLEQEVVHIIRSKSPEQQEKLLKIARII